MKLGIITDSLAHLSIDKLLSTLAEFKFDCVEFACGNWSRAPHIPLDALIDSEKMRKEFLAKIKDHGLGISALNCSGNQLHPVTGKKQDEVVRKTFKLANLLGVPRIVMMSGLPGGGPDDKYANWVTTAWPPETAEILKYQWDRVAIPYWKDLVAYGKNLGITKIAIENHGAQIVYNPETLLKLRNAVGPTVGINYDPSHIMWMGGDAIRAIRILGDAIFHVHAKDTRLDSFNQATNTLIETKDNAKVTERSWNYVTLGYGHDELFWAEFVSQLRMVGYDDVLSIEHEDFLLDNLEAVKKSADFMQRILLRLPASYGGASEA